MNRKTHHISISLSLFNFLLFLSITIESICISSSVQNLFLKKETKMENLINYKKKGK